MPPRRKWSAPAGCRWGQIAGAAEFLLAHKTPATKVPCMQAALLACTHLPLNLPGISRIFSSLQIRMVYGDRAIYQPNDNLRSAASVIHQGSKLDQVER